MARGYRVRGVKEVQQVLRRMGAAAGAGLARELFIEGEGIMGASKPLVPVMTGALRSTGHVKPPVVEQGTIKVTLGYGGPAGAEDVTPEGRGRYVGYALKVHEDLDAYHTTGQAKFLEQPAMEASKGMAARIAGNLRADLEAQSAR